MNSRILDGKLCKTLTCVPSWRLKEGGATIGVERTPGFSESGEHYAENHFSDQSKFSLKEMKGSYHNLKF